MVRHYLFLAVVALGVSTGVAEAQVTREVVFNAHAVIPLTTKLRFTTLIVLPESEQILDFVCGDKEFWVVSGAQNLAYVKPAKAGATTNLTLVTASGHVYAFLLTEGGSGDADLKVSVMRDDATPGAGEALKRFYTPAEVDALRQAAETARTDATSARETAARTVEERVNSFRTTYPTRLDFAYRYPAHKKPFFVDAIYTDGAFTYIKANAKELPALYEVRDGRPNLINFQVEHGTYIVPKVLDSGYLSVGHQTLRFERFAR